MSWSVNATGKASELKAKLAPDFAQAKKQTERFPHESDGVTHAEAAVNGQLDFLAALQPEKTVKVTAHGSSYGEAGKPGDSSLFVEVKSVA